MALLTVDVTILMIVSFKDRGTRALAEGPMKRLAPITPGEILLEDFLRPMGISQYRLAKEIGVPAQRISEIVAGRRSITADTDLRLCRFFGLSNGYWLRAQAAHDTEVAAEALGEVLDRIRPWGGGQPAQTNPSRQSRI